MCGLWFYPDSEGYIKCYVCEAMCIKYNIYKIIIKFEHCLLRDNP